MISTVIQVVAFIAFMGGALTVAVVIAVAVLHALDKGLDLVPRLIRLPSSPTRNPIEKIRYRSNYGANRSEVPVHPQISPQKIAYGLITRFGAKVLQVAVCNRRSPCQNTDTKEQNEKYSRYPKCFVPVKHIVTIVDRLRRRVNQSGKEPLVQC